MDTFKFSFSCIAILPWRNGREHTGKVNAHMLQSIIKLVKIPVMRTKKGRYIQPSNQVQAKGNLISERVTSFVKKEIVTSIMATDGERLCGMKASFDGLLRWWRKMFNYLCSLATAISTPITSADCSPTGIASINLSCIYWRSADSSGRRDLEMSATLNPVGKMLMVSARTVWYLIATSYPQTKMWYFC